MGIASLALLIYMQRQYIQVRRLFFFKARVALRGQKSLLPTYLINIVRLFGT